MKIFINSHDRADTISTPQLLDEGGVHSYKIILHSPEERLKYLQNPQIRPETLVVASMPIGMVGIRNWILETQVEDGEWFAILDDNITELQSVPEPAYSEAVLNVKGQPGFYKKMFEHKIDAKRMLEVFEDSIREADRIGAKLVGFGSNLNFFFRAKKFRQVGYVIGKTQLIKKTHLRYDLNVWATDDYLWTAQNLETFGKVLINNYFVAVKKHYAPGGIGVYADRVKHKVKEVKYMMGRFPGLFRFKFKKGCHPKAEIQVRFTSRAQVERWKAFMRTRKSAV